MLRLALSTVRNRRFGFAGSFVAVTLAVALVCAWFTLLLSGLGAAPAVDRFGAVTAVVRMDPALTVRTGPEDEEKVPLDQPPRLPAEFAERVRAIEGVTAVIPDTPFYAQVISKKGVPLAGPGDGPSVGHGWAAAALTPFTLRTGRAPASPDEVVLDADLARRAEAGPGSTLRVVTDVGVQTMRVSGVAAPRGRTGLPRQATLFFARPADGRPQFLGVVAEPGTPLAARLRPTGAEVLTGRDAARAGSPEIGDQLEYATLFLGPMGGIGLFLAIFVIAGTFGLSILQRGREIALLRAIGATPGQVRRMLLAEACSVALVAAVPGCLLGVPLAHLVLRLMIANDIATTDFEIQVSTLPFFVATGAGLLVSLLAVTLSAHHAARVRATEALREAAAPRRLMPLPRLLLGLAALAGAIPIHLLSQRVGGEVGVAFQYLTVMILMIAAVALAPLLTRLLTPVVGAAVTPATTGWLAAAGSRTAPRRVASAASAVMLSTALGSTALLVGASIESTAIEQSGQRVVADRILTPHNASGLPASVASTAARLPSVKAVSALRSTTFISTVLGAPESMVAQGVAPESIDEVLAPGIRAGSLKALAQPGTVAVSRTHARERGWSVGSRINGTLGDGTPMTLRVVAIYDRSLGLGDFLLARSALTGHLHDNLDDAVLIKARTPNLDRDLSTLGIPTVKTLNAPAYAQLSRSGLSQSTTNVYIVLGLLVAFTAISIVNTCVMGTAERAREFALLRLVGASRGQVVRTICMETAIASVIGTIIGAAIGLVALAGASGALTGTMSLHPSASRLAIILIAVAALTLLVSVLPAAMVMRYRPAAALGRRE
ncbi:FtsX-like permease family protein [Spirillospora sp. NPDC048911]|uniref:FtsX-like permease family protein n=1 Tax=Spirillospora sp. NPDC048911 TaxID=3364527 RepID=UPI003722BC7B